MVSHVMIIDFWVIRNYDLCKPFLPLFYFFQSFIHFNLSLLMHDKRYFYSDGNKIKRFCLFSLGSGYNGSNEKRRKPMQMSSMTYMLEDGDIIEDLKIINKNKAFSVSSCLLTTKNPKSICLFSIIFQMQKINTQSSTSSTGGSSPSYYRDTRIEEGKLFYEKRWY